PTSWRFPWTCSPGPCTAPPSYGASWGRSCGSRCGLGLSIRLDTGPEEIRSGGRMKLRILVALFRINVAEELQYRSNFLAILLGTLFWIVTALLTLAVFFRHTKRLGDWDFWEVVVLLVVFNTLTGVIEALLRPGIGRLAGEVKSGGLDL